MSAAFFAAAANPIIPVGGVSEVLRVAADELGYVEEGGPDQHSGNLTKYWQELDPELQGSFWCAVWVSWVFKHAGHPLPAIDRAYGFISVPSLRRYATAVGRLVHEPQAGDIAIYWGGEHTGIIKEPRKGGAMSYEGNTSPQTLGSQVNGGGVHLRQRSLADMSDGLYRPIWV